MNLSWLHVVGITALVTVLFFVLGQTKLGMMVNTIIFMFITAAVLVVMKLVSDNSNVFAYY